jgi:hypothetical protein
VRAVTVVAILGQDRLDIAHEINRAGGSRGQFRGGGGRSAKDSKRRAGKEFPDLD